MKTNAAIILGTLALLLGVAVFAGGANSQEQLPEQSPFLTACAVAQSLGEDQSLPVTNCRLVGEAVNGNRAQVVVSVRVAGQGRFMVKVGLFRSVWGMHTVTVTPQGG